MLKPFMYYGNNLIGLYLGEKKKCVINKFVEIGSLNW